MAEQSNTLVTVKSNSSLQTETESETDVTEEDTSEKVLLIGESTRKKIPAHLQTIIEKLEDFNKTDLLVCVLYVLMIETGFIPKQFKDDFDDNNIHFHIGRLDFLSFLPKNWKTDESYKIEFIISPFPDRLCKMFCVASSQNLIVNLILKSLDKFCMQLNTSKYILKETILPVSKRFANLRELSNEFKNQIALPAKSSILTIEGVPHASLQDLPSEIIYKIFVELEAVDLLHLKGTCKRMQDCANYYEHEIWGIYFKRDFPHVCLNNIKKWDAKYKDEYKLRLRRKREASGIKRKPRLIYDII